MAGNDRNTTFILDGLLDGEPEIMSGFDDFKAPEKPEPAQKTQDLEKEPELEKKPENDGGEGLPSGKDRENKPDEKQATNDHPDTQRWNELATILTKKDEQISTLVDQVKALTDKVTAPAQPEPEKPQPPVKPQFTPQQWEDDYEGCVNATLDYREELKNYNQGIEQAETETRAKTEASQLQTTHQKDYADECADLPALTDPKIKQVFANIFYDPANQLHTKPDGVLRAVKELKRQAKERNIDLSQFGGQPEKTTETKAEPAAQDPAKLAEDEAARKARVASGVMHTGGKQSSDGAGLHLTPEQIAVANKFRISPEAYAKTLAAMPGRKK